MRDASWGSSVCADRSRARSPAFKCSRARPLDRIEQQPPLVATIIACGEIARCRLSVPQDRLVWGCGALTCAHIQNMHGYLTLGGQDTGASASSRVRLAGSRLVGGVCLRTTTALPPRCEIEPLALLVRPGAFFSPSSVSRLASVRLKLRSPTRSFELGRSTTRSHHQKGP